eukprot:9090263-Pyramimonas_sp.AAC.1
MPGAATAQDRSGYRPGQQKMGSTDTERRMAVSPPGGQPPARTRLGGKPTAKRRAESHAHRGRAGGRPAGDH